VKRPVSEEEKRHVRLGVESYVRLAREHR